MEKACCDNCEEGLTCESELPKTKKNHDHKNLYGLRTISNKKAIEQLLDELDKPRIDENRIDIIEDDRTVLEAIVRPDRHRNVSFPSYFGTPGTPIHKMNTIELRTNARGVCWASVNLGQYLGLNSWAAVTAHGTADPLNLTNTTNGKLFGLSNVFYSDPTTPLLTCIDGSTPYNPSTTNITQFIPSTALRENIIMYNAVRAGPASVWYDFTGRLDTSSGTVTAGINYTYFSDALSNAPNGLLPDMNFITQKAIDDCPYKIKGSVVNSIQGVFLPQDSQVLDLKSTSAGNTNIQQRFFLLITGAAANETIGQLTIATNFDGKPNAQYADSISTSITRSPSLESLKSATDYMIAKGLVLRIAKDQGYGIMRFSQ